MKYNNAKPDANTLIITSLKHNFAWTLMGNITYAATQWGIIVVYAKTGTPVTVGIYALALAITAPIYMLTNLQLRGILATDVKNDFSFHDYFRLRLTASLLTLFLICILAIALGYNATTSLIIAGIGLSKFFESMSDICHGLLQKHEMMKRIAVSMMMRGILSLAVVFVTMWTTGNVVASVFIMACVWFGVLYAYDYKNSKALSGSATSISKLWHLSSHTKLLLTSLPLGFVMMLGSLNSSIPRFFLEKTLGTKELGIFAAMAYLLVAGTTIVNALGQSATPRLAKLYAFNDKKALLNLLLKIQAIVIVLGIAGIGIAYFFGKPILTMVYTKEYADYSTVFTVILLSAVVTYGASILGCFVTATRHFKVQLPVSCVMTLCMALASYILISRHGLMGAAYALIATAVVQLLLFTMVSFKIVRNIPTDGVTRV